MKKIHYRFGNITRSVIVGDCFLWETGFGIDSDMEIAKLTDIKYYIPQSAIEYVEYLEDGENE